MSLLSGRHYEKMACDFLKARGLNCLMQNYQAKCGEIDLIMQDPTSDTVIFVEVRFRTSVQMGSAIETIGPSKQKKLSRTALHFLQKQGWTNRYPCRFDVMGIHLDQTKPQFHWIPNAF